MFAKLKKKVEESEGSDLHKLANSIGSATISLAEKTFSMNSVKSSDNLAMGPSQEPLGSRTSLTSLNSNTAPSETEIRQKIESKWKQKFTEMENEWRAKVIVREHERDELARERSFLSHQIKQLEEKLKQMEDHKEKSESLIKHLQSEYSDQSAHLRSAVAEADALVKKLSLKSLQDDDLIKQLKSQCEEKNFADAIRDKSSEVEELRSSLAETRQMEIKLQTAQKEQEAALKLELETERLKSENFTSELARLNSDYRKALDEIEEKSAKVATVAEEKNACLVRNAELSQQLSLCQQQLQRSEKELGDVLIKREQLIEENAKLKSLLEKVGAGEDVSEKSVQLKSYVAELEATLQEKNKTIKLQQQRLTDMKKTLQKELKNSSHLLAPEEPGQAASGHSPSASRTSPTIFPPTSPSAISGPSDSTIFMEPVNFKYLKHVIFKFLTSREYEAQHLTRAVSTLLKLSPEEDKLLKETLEWKMSWFRAKPDLGSGQHAMYIPPSH